MDEKIKEVHKLYIKAQEAYAEEEALSRRGQNYVILKAKYNLLGCVMKILDPENTLDI